MSRIISIDVTDPSLTITEVVPERKDALLVTCHAVNGSYMVLKYRRNVQSEVYIADMSGNILEHVAEDFIGTIVVKGRRSWSFFWATGSGFTSPSTIYQYDFERPCYGACNRLDPSGGY